MNASTLNVGLGAPEAGITTKTTAAAESNVTNFDTYSDTEAFGGSSTILSLRKSHSDSVDTLVTTLDGENIGTILFVGVGGGNIWDGQAKIQVIQNGAAAPNGSGDMTLEAGDAEGQLLLYNDGRVGVNMGGSTPTPSWPFSIGSTDYSDQIGIYHDNTDAFMKWEDGSLFLQTDEGTNTDGIVGILGKGSGEAFLGVGVAAPERQFHLMVSDASLAPQWQYSALLIEENASTGQGTGIEILTPNDAFGGLVFSDGNTGPDGAVWYYHADDSMRFRTAATVGNEVVIDATGQLGVLTGDPAASLDVDGSALFNVSEADKDFRVAASAITNAFFVQGSDGYVGIGTGAPGTLAHIQAATNAQLRIESTGANANVFQSFKNDARQWNWEVRGDSGDIFRLRNSTSATNPFIINPAAPSNILNLNVNGVGIGIAAPTDFLELFGDAKYLGFNQDGTDSYNGSRFLESGTPKAYIQYFGGTYATAARQNNLELITVTGDIIMQRDGTNKVGIATDAPSHALHVEGDCLIGASATSYVEIEADGDVNFVAGAGHQLGEIWYHGAGSDLVMAAQDTWYQIVSFDTDGDANGSAVPAHASDHITVGKAGIYRVSFGASIRSAASNVYEIQVFTNNGANPFENGRAHRATTVAGKIGDVSRSVFCTFAANDTVELWAQRIDGGAVSKTLTFEQVVLNVEQAGGITPP